MTKFNSNVLGLEAIAHQDTAFFKQLSDLFRPLCLNRMSANDVDLHVRECNAIEKLIKQRTNISIEFKIERSEIPNAYVMPPSLNKSHIFYQDWAKPYYSNIDSLKLLNTLSEKFLQGTLNREKVWVTGFFEQLIHRTRITHTMLNEAQAEECAAILLHELGHVWSYYELLSLTAKTNIALRTVKHEFLNTTDNESKIIVVRAAQNSLGITEPEIQEILKTGSVNRLEIAVINSQARESYSELGFSLYDQRGWEFASDQFSARMGGGRYVVSGLHAIQSKYREYNNQSYFAHVTTNVLKAFGLIIGSILSLGMVPLMMFLMGDPYSMEPIHPEVSGMQAKTYDSPKERFTRIKHELIAALRNLKISKERTEELVKDIQYIESVVNSIVERPSFTISLWALFSVTGKNKRNNVKIQQALEVLANNDLYVAAAQLRTM